MIGAILIIVFGGSAGFTSQQVPLETMSACAVVAEKLIVKSYVVAAVCVEPMTTLGPGVIYHGQ